MFFFFFLLFSCARIDVCQITAHCATKADILDWAASPEKWEIHLLDARRGLTSLLIHQINIYDIVHVHIEGRLYPSFEWSQGYFCYVKVYNKNASYSCVQSRHPDSHVKLPYTTAVVFRIQESGVVLCWFHTWFALPPPSKKETMIKND